MFSKYISDPVDLPHYKFLKVESDTEQYSLSVTYPTKSLQKLHFIQMSFYSCNTATTALQSDRVKIPNRRKAVTSH